MNHVYGLLIENVSTEMVLAVVTKPEITSGLQRYFEPITSVLTVHNVTQPGEIISVFPFFEGDR